MHQVLWEGDTLHGHYQVVDTLYDGRPARVLYSGDRQAAQSGVAQDANPDLLFDYNQRLFELVTSLAPERVLLIGGGVFTLPTALLRALPHTCIDAVEIDVGLTGLAKEFFDLSDSERLHIFNTDGRSFLRACATRYDMILVDAFNHITIPREIKTMQAFNAYARHLNSSGVLAMNVISGYYGPSARTLGELYAAAVRTFDAVDIFLATRGCSLWLPQNFILTAQKGRSLPLKDYMRYEAVIPPEIDPAVALED